MGKGQTTSDARVGKIGGSLQCVTPHTGRDCCSSPVSLAVVYDFEAIERFEVALFAGESVEILQQSTGCNWFQGRVIGRGTKGVFPVSFIELSWDEPFPPPDPSAAARAETAERLSRSQPTSSEWPCGRHH